MQLLNITNEQTSSVSSRTVMMPGSDDCTTPYESSVYDTDTRWDKPINRWHTTDSLSHTVAHNLFSSSLLTTIWHIP